MREYESNHLLAVGGSWSELKCLLAANDDLIGKIEPPLSATSKRKAASGILSVVVRRKSTKRVGTAYPAK